MLRGAGSGGGVVLLTAFVLSCEITTLQFMSILLPLYRGKTRKNVIPTRNMVML